MPASTRVATCPSSAAAQARAHPRDRTKASQRRARARVHLPSERAGDAPAIRAKRGLPGESLDLHPRNDGRPSGSEDLPIAALLLDAYEDQAIGAELVVALPGSRGFYRPKRYADPRGRSAARDLDTVARLAGRSRRSQQHHSATSPGGSDSREKFALLRFELIICEQTCRVQLTELLDLLKDLVGRSSWLRFARS